MCDKILDQMTKIDNLTLELTEAKIILEDMFDQLEIDNILNKNIEMLIILG